MISFFGNHSVAALAGGKNKSDWRFLFDYVNRGKLQKALSFIEDKWKQASIHDN
jgi:hypothetical protein